MINARNTLGTGRHRSGRTFIFGVVLAVAALALLARAGEAQEFELVGTIVDANTGQALQNAWVGLTGTDWGSITNEQGRFRIEDVVAGRLSLKIEQLGYETLEWDGYVSSGDPLLLLELNAQPIVLEGLRVVTDRFRSRRNAVATSVYTYQAAELANSYERSALDFIRYRAHGARVVSCQGRLGDTCLSIRGRAVEPVVYIDEIPVLGGLDRLDSFAPWDLYMVEIYGRGRHIRAYTPQFMKQAAERRLLPIALPY